MLLFMGWCFVCKFVDIFTSVERKDTERACSEEGMEWEKGEEMDEGSHISSCALCYWRPSLHHSGRNASEVVVGCVVLDGVWGKMKPLRFGVFHQQMNLPVSTNSWWQLIIVTGVQKSLSPCAQFSLFFQGGPTWPVKHFSDGNCQMSS